MMQQHTLSRRRILFFMLLGLAAVVAIGYFVASALISSSKSNPGTGESSARSPIAVRVAKAEMRTLTPAVEVIGSVQPDPARISILAAATTGSVEKLAVREGTRVAKNDLVIQLDERPAKLALDRAEAAYARLIAKPRPEELDQARLLVEKVEAAHALAASRLKKAEELRARNEELVPAIELQDEQRNEEATKAEWESAQAQAKLLNDGPSAEVRRESQVEVETAKLQLEYCQVRSPIAGEVVEFRASVGQRADVGIPLATILDTSEVVVQARVPSDRLAGVLAAMETGGQEALASIHCPAFPHDTFTARGGWLSQQTEAQTSDVPIKLRVPNLKRLLRPGMTVQVELHEQGVEGLAIPEAAVTVNEEGHRIVTLIRNGKAVPTEITIASDKEPEVRAGGWIRVLSGLEPGDEVAIENGYALPKDTPVVVLSPETATGSP
jgi:multidrug efflux pump subunit AcrA (membrane-fusion protein)